MPELVRLQPGQMPGPEILRRAAEAARRGQLVAFPTDTVYGLGTSALSREGVERIYRLKGRSPDKPLPLLTDSIKAAGRWAQLTPQAEILARRFWPGGLTLVLLASPEGRKLANVQGPTVAVRVPDHPVALALVAACGAPWAQSSANVSGEPPLTDGAAIARRFGDDLAFAIDAGPAAGAASTVVDASVAPVRILREGRVPAAAVRAALERVSAAPQNILFVCTGNTCRSVMAEFLCRKLAPDRGLQSRSAGVAAQPAFAIPSGVRAALGAEGITDVEHRPQPVTQEILDWADLVLAMERSHRDLLLSRFPQSADKIRTLKDQDVKDPIGQPDEAYAACCREIKTALEAIFHGHVPHP